MPTAIGTINAAKEQAATYQPLLLVEITFADASVLRLSTHALNTAEGGAAYGGNNYLGRISQQDIGQFQSLSETGIDLIPTVTITLADPDAYLYQNWEKTKGIKGAILTARLVFYDVDAGTFSSDSRIPFIGICEKPSLDVRALTISAVSRTQLMKSLLPIVPIQPRCPWINPTTATQRADADNPDSPFYECGEIRDTVTAPPCDYTKATCTRTMRFGGVTYKPPEGMHVREYTSGAWADVKGNGNDAKYGDYFPMPYGTVWLEPPVMNVIPDGNYVRGEVVVCVGAADIIKVVVNDLVLSPANDSSGAGYSYANRDFRYNWINAGRRDGSPNADVPYNSAGDPYGSMTAFMFVVPRANASGDGVPRVRVLVRRKGIRKYQALSSIVVASNVATATLVGANTDIASNDSSWAFTIEGTSGTTINAAWAGLTNWTAGPPGTFTFTTSGVANGTYTGGYIRYTADTDNPVWILADILTWTNYRYADLDLASVAAVAIKLATRPASLVIRQRQSAQEIIRGLRQAFGLVLVPDHSTGKLSLSVRETLADQQPSAIDGSNYNTAVSSVNAAGTTTNGYVAYKFDAASILRRDQPTSLKELSRAASDAPNRISFTFADKDHEWEQSSISVVDSDDTARMQGQEIAGSLTVQPVGITSYADAIRAARVGQAEIHRGNEAGDTRGTRYFEWEASFRALHLRVGQLVILSDTRHGLTNQLIRLTKIQPSQNYETVKLTGHWHSDTWYTTAYATSGAPVLVSRRHDVLARPAFAWSPDMVAPLSGDTLFAVSDKAFAVDQAYTTAADGSKVAQLTITGATPINAYSTAAPPTVPLQASTSTTGGSIAGNRVLWLAICSKDSSGNLGAPSPLVRADIPSGTATNTVTISGLSWAAGVTGYVLFAGLDPNALTAQAESSTTPSSVTLVSLSERAWGIPDCEFDHLAVRVKRIAKAGVLVAQISSVTATTITVSGATWTTNQWAGRDVSVMGSAGSARVPLASFRVASNTATVLTLAGGSPSPLSYSLGAGDYIVIRCAPSSASTTTVTDSGLGLATDEMKGKLLRVISGKARGQVTRITSNSASSLYGNFSEALDTTSRFVIEQADWQYTADGSTIEKNGDRTAPIAVTVEVGNVTADALLVEAVTIDGGGAESTGNPVREIILTGAVGAGGSGNTTVADPTGLTFGSATILDNGLVRVTFSGTAPTSADWAGYKRIIEIPTWGQTNCAEIALPGDLYDKGDHFCPQTAAFSDVMEFDAPPLEWLEALSPGTVVQYVLYLLPFTWGNTNQFVRLTDAVPKTPTNGTPCFIFTVDYAGFITGGGVESGLGDITIRSATGYPDPPTVDWSLYSKTGQVFCDLAYEPYYTGSGASRATVHRGVHAFVETVVGGSATPADASYYAYDSEKSLIAWEGNKGTFRCYWTPFAGDVWLQGCAIGDSTQFPWKRASGASPLAPSTRWRKITISSGDMAAHAGQVIGPAQLAPNATAITASAIYDGDKFGAVGIVTWPSTDRALIRRARLILKTSGSATSTILLPWLDAPSGSTTSYSTLADQPRPATDTTYTVSVEVENAAGVVTTSPTASTGFTVLAVSTAATPNGTYTASRTAPIVWTSTGNETYGLDYSGRWPNSADFDYGEVWVNVVEDPLSYGRGFIAQTKHGGADANAAFTGRTDSWPMYDYAFTARVIFYAFAVDGTRTEITHVDVAITPATTGFDGSNTLPGTLPVTAIDPADFGAGVAVRGGIIVGTVKGSLLNGDFEDGLTSWEATAGVSIDTSVKFSGAQSCKIVGSSTARYVRQAIQAVPGQAYAFSVSVRNDTPSPGVVVAQFVDAAGAFLGSGINENAFIAAAGVWQTVTRTTEIAPAGTAYLMIYPLYLGAANTGNAWVDAVSAVVPIGNLDLSKADLSTTDGFRLNPTTRKLEMTAEAVTARVKLGAMLGLDDNDALVVTGIIGDWVLAALGAFSSRVYIANGSGSSVDLLASGVVTITNGNGTITLGTDGAITIARGGNNVSINSTTISFNVGGTTPLSISSSGTSGLKYADITNRLTIGGASNQAAAGDHGHAYSDLTGKPTLGTAAGKNVGLTVSDVAAGYHEHYNGSGITGNWSGTIHGRDGQEITVVNGLATAEHYSS